MPTPFYHLDVAETLLKQSTLPSGIRNFLEQHSPAFLLGHTAPDVQVVSGQKRSETHFYRMPIREADLPPWERILLSHPGFAHPADLSSPQAAFLAGYLCHLQADWMWAKQVFQPVFGPQAAWKSFQQRLYLHNVLRSYLDLQVLSKLNGHTRADLERLRPNRWLPFVDDDHLRAWRDLLANQLKPGAEIQTVEVFATRQGISPVEYYRLLDSELALDKEIFVHLPRHRLEIYWQNLIAENLVLLQTYLRGF